MHFPSDRYEFVLNFLDEASSRMERFSNPSVSDRAARVIAELGSLSFANLLLQQTERMAQTLEAVNQVSVSFAQLAAVGRDIDQSVMDVAQQALGLLGEIEGVYESLWAEEDQILKPLKDWITQNEHEQADCGQAAQILLDFYNSNEMSLDLSGLHLTSLPDLLWHPSVIERLEDLDLSYSEFEQLPEEIGLLINLKRLRLYGSEKLRCLPESFGQLILLSELEIAIGDEKKESHGSAHEPSWPSSMGNLKSLRKLKINGCSMQRLPAWVEGLIQLQELDVSFCQMIQMPSLEALTALRRLNVSHNHIQQLPEDERGFGQLTVLHVHHNPIQKLPKQIISLRQLQLISLYATELCEEQKSALQHSQDELAYAGPVICIDQDRLKACEKRLQISLEIRNIYENAKRSLEPQKLRQLQKIIGPLFEEMTELPSEDPADEGYSSFEKWQRRLALCAPLAEERRKQYFSLMVEILEALPDNTAFQDFFKVIVPESLTTCGDRFLLHLIKLDVQMQGIKLALDDPQAVYSYLKRGPIALEVIENLCRSLIHEKEQALKAELAQQGLSAQELEERIQQSLDPVEYFLFLPLEVSRRLDLVFTSQRMQFAHVVSLSPSEIEQSVTLCQQQLDDHDSMLDRVIANSLWQQCLQLVAPEKLMLIDESVDACEDLEESEQIRKIELKKLSAQILSIKEPGDRKPRSKRPCLD
jgi:hypothetical protein